MASRHWQILAPTFAQLFEFWATVSILSNFFDFSSAFYQSDNFLHILPFQIKHRTKRWWIFAIAARKYELLSPTLRPKTAFHIKTRPSLSDIFSENGPNLNVHKIAKFYSRDLKLWIWIVQFELEIFENRITNFFFHKYFKIMLGFEGRWLFCVFFNCSISNRI